ncbi:MAG: histidinol dehydrogenase [Candidatus Eremiobacteraeota bacterium]|nr:histidinol dehydrogenase [Candidatus Eremiobacteraeota bacterium]
MNVTAASDAAALGELLEAGWRAPDEIVREVAAVIADVRDRGDAAIVQYARRFDDPQFDSSKLRVAVPDVEVARSSIPQEVAAALELLEDRIARFHRRQRQPEVAYVEADGTRYAMQRLPLQSVAVYTPRTAPATLALMGVVPARIAGVSRIAILSPPSPHGMSPALLFACALCGVRELYAVGGAQAIAAAAFGSGSIARVDKIVGRAGIRTTEAKRQVFGLCGVDSVAGPPEILVVADDGANSEYVVGELLAASEVPGVRRLAVLSESRPLLEAVAQLIDTLDLRTLERNEFVSAAIDVHCRLIEASSHDELFAVLNRIAPAYISLQVRDPAFYLERIHTAGIVLVGDTTPLASGEYLAGTSNMIPTHGTARFSSALSLSDFMRSYSIVEYSSERMTNDASALMALAEFDGLPHRAQTARMRCGG